MIATSDCDSKKPASFQAGSVCYVTLPELVKLLLWQVISYNVKEDKKKIKCFQ